jgi:hypothetical protein
MTLPEDLAPTLTDGVVLCHLANHIKPRSVASIHVPSPAVVSEIFVLHNLTANFFHRLKYYENFFISVYFCLVFFLNSALKSRLRMNDSS